MGFIYWRATWWIYFVAGKASNIIWILFHNDMAVEVVYFVDLRRSGRDCRACLLWTSSGRLARNIGRREQKECYGGTQTVICWIYIAGKKLIRRHWLIKEDQKSKAKIWNSTTIQQIKLIFVFVNTI